MSGPTTTDRATLLAYVTAARWFGGKGRIAEVTGRTPLPWLQPVGQWPAVRTEIVEISFTDAGGTPEGRDLYQLLLSYYPERQPALTHAEVGPLEDPELGPVHAYDGAQDAVATALLLQHLVEGSAFGGEEPAGTQFRTSRTGVLATGLEPVPFGGQQSNTSIMYGDVAMLKLFRRIELGRNLDIAVHDRLSRAGVADVAQLYGWVQGHWPAGAHDPGATLETDLAMVVEKLARALDGWQLALDSLGDGASFAADATALGASLRHIHTALEAGFDTTVLAGDEVAAVMAARLDAALAVAPALEPYEAGLRSAFARLRGSRLEGQRVHGDFHLGQTLSTPDGWKIIDFEGEPAKSMAERLAPDSALRDVAGMLRSFDYAAASRPGAGAAGWLADCRSAFLTGYFGTGSNEQAAALAAYEADKAVYEVVYEVRNRPDWVHIPLGAVASLAGATAPPPASPSAPTDEGHPS